MFKEIKNAINSKTLFPKGICWILEKAGLTNYMLQALQVRNWNYRYMKKKYSYVIKTDSYPSATKGAINKNIWICWLQGEEKAPDLVKKCITSVRRYMDTYDIHIITSANLNEYIEIPEYIVDKWKSSIISNALMSDIIRTELLIKYGGLWLDATVLLTGPVPEYVYSNQLFMYTHSYPDDITITYNSWLIYSDSDNRLLKTVRALLYEYWKNETSIREYFMWHLFMTMAVEKYPGDANEINYITDELPEIFARIIFRKYDPDFWESLKSITPVHKLSNKFCFPDCVTGTYYEEILS